MEEHTYLEKMKLAHSLLLDASTGRAAAYTPNHRLVTPLATSKLVQYALDHTAHRVPFDPALHAAGAPDWRPLPDWATADLFDRLELIWIAKPDADDHEAWRAYPKR